MNTRFTVGEVAKLNNISKQTLIFYDNEGIFKPKYIDPENGYRYYTADQLEVLDSILILKEMGLSLKEIKMFMEHRNSRIAITLMKKQQFDINNKIKHLKSVAKRLELKIETLENFQADENNITFINKIKPQFIAVEKVSEPKGPLELDIAIKRLLRNANKKNYSHYYQIGAIIPLENLLNKKYLCAEYAFLPLDNKMIKESVLEKPQGLYVRCYHTGAYSQIGKTYEKLLEEIKNRNYTPMGFAYEFCIFDSLTSKKSDDYVTEIQIMVVPCK